MKEKPKVSPCRDGAQTTWLSQSKSPDELRALLRPYDASLMEAYAVSRAVNSVKNDTEECIEPIDDEVARAEGISTTYPPKFA